MGPSVPGHRSPSEAGLSWDLLCKTMIEESLKQLQANTTMKEPSLGSTSESKGWGELCLLISGRWALLPSNPRMLSSSR